MASAERRQNGRAEGWQEGISPDPQRRPPLTYRRALNPTGPGHRERSFGALLTRIFPLVQRPFCTAQNDQISRVSPTRFGLSIAPHAPDRKSSEIATSRPNPVTSLAHLGRWGLEIGAMKTERLLFRLKRRETSQTETLGATAARRIAF